MFSSPLNTLQSGQSGTCYAVTWAIPTQCDQSSINHYHSFRVAGNSTLPVLHSPWKAPGAFTELLAWTKHSGAQHTHTHLLCPHMHSRQSSALPHCHGQSITQTRLQNSPSSVLRAAEIPRGNSWGLLPAAGVIRGGGGTTILQQLLCFYKDEGISMKPANGILVALELRILRLFWQDRFEAVLMFLCFLVLSSWK